MGKLLGPLKMTGRLDGITFYRRGDSIIGRSSRGVNGELVKTADNFERTRENNGEFKLATILSKHIRGEILKWHSNCFDTHTHSRMNGAILSVIKNDKIHVRGSRRFTDGLGKPEVVQAFIKNSINIHAEMDHLIKGKWDYTDTFTDLKLNINYPLKDVGFPATNTVANVQRVQVFINENTMEKGSVGSGIQIIQPQKGALSMAFAAPLTPPLFKGIVMDLVVLYFTQTISNDEYILHAKNLNAVDILGVEVR
ncbi:MAG: hypothetical protein IT244_00445 [Bacteroidia bacterium]|nr:hypothetical protein [Bacteroidia bacterium]